MAKLLIPPDSEGYTFKYGPRAVSTKLEGGAAKYRQDILGATTEITVKWKLKPANYKYLMAFYRTATKNGSLPFQIDLVLDGENRAEYTARFVDGTFGLETQEGDAFIVTASLEVEGAPPTETQDNDTITAGPQ